MNLGSDVVITITGIVLVFAILVLLMLIITLEGKIFDGMAAKKKAAKEPAAPKAAAKPAAPVQPAQQPINPPMPNPIFTQSFSTGMDTPVAAQPAAPAEEEDDGDYFDDLLSILNKRS